MKRLSGTPIGRHKGVEPGTICEADGCYQFAVERFKGQELCHYHLIGEEVPPIPLSAVGCALADLKPPDAGKSVDFNWHKWLKKHTKKNGRRTFLVTDEGA